MDLEQEDSTRERLFVLRLMDFVYKIAGKPLQTCLQQMLDEYPQSRESYFSEKITQAILIYIKDFRSSDVNLVDLASPAYQDKIEDLFTFYHSFDFLKFLAHYSWKSAEEYYSNKLLDSPAKFFSSILLFLEKMRKAGRCDDDFWKLLEASATRVIARDLELMKYENPNFKDVLDDETMASEREFILEVMRMVSVAYKNPLPPYLSEAFEEFIPNSTFEYNQNLVNALDMAMESLERNVLELGGDDSICEYFYGLCKNGFNARDFLEYCVCSTRKALFEYYGDLKDDSPQKAYDRLFSLVQTAKKAGKYNSVHDFIDGAHEIIAKETEKNEAFERKLNDVSTDIFTDVSTESNSPSSDWENLIPPCDCIFPGKDSGNNKSSGQKSKLKKLSKSATKNVTSPGKNIRHPKDNKISPKIAKAKLPIDKTSDQNPRTAKETLNLSKKTAQLATSKAIIKENAKLVIKKVAASDVNSQLATETLITSEENTLSAIDKVISGKNVQLTDNSIMSEEHSEQVTATLRTSEENTLSATEKAITKENVQLTDNSSMSGENTEMVDIIATKEHSQPTSEDASMLGKSTPPALKKEINFGESVQLTFESLSISSEKAHSSNEKAISSSDSTKEASESQNLMASSEHKNGSCKCCKNCCTTT